MNKVSRMGDFQCSDSLKQIACKECKYCKESGGVKFPQHLHCKHYAEDMKPLDVAFGKKPCEFFEKQEE